MFWLLFSYGLGFDDVCVVDIDGGWYFRIYNWFNDFRLIDIFMILQLRYFIRGIETYDIIFDFWGIGDRIRKSFIEILNSFIIISLIYNSLRS
jgi:hypothetical protein